MKSIRISRKSSWNGYFPIYWRSGWIISGQERKLKEMDEELVMKDPFTSFAEFYKEMQGREMNGEEETIMKEIFDKAKGVE